MLTNGSAWLRVVTCHVSWFRLWGYFWFVITGWLAVWSQTRPSTLVKAVLCHSTEACGKKPGNFLSLCERRTLYPSCGSILLPPKGQSSYCHVIALNVPIMIMFLERVGHQWDLEVLVAFMAVTTRKKQGLFLSSNITRRSSPLRQATYLAQGLE